MRGLFITFEGTEGSGKTTQIRRLADRLTALGHKVRVLREPGGTPIGEEIRNTLKHSEDNVAMTAEAELLLMNASRAQIVREVIRPALAAGEIILCDRFYDSTTAYQGYGRGLDLPFVKNLVEFAVGGTQPDLTVYFVLPVKASEERRLARREALLLDVPTDPKQKGFAKLPFNEPMRDRMEEADRDFFERVARGYDAIAAAEPQRVRPIDATASVEQISARIWELVGPLAACRK
jgi:dTMP kinase